MNMSKSHLSLVAMTVVGGVTLSACDSSSSSDSDTAQFSLAVSDSPVNRAETVMVCFNSIELVGNGMGSQRYVIGDDAVAVEANDACLDEDGNVIPNTRGIDLLTLQGADSEALIERAELPAGSYGQLRLDIAAGGYVEVDGDRHPIRIPSDQLRLDGPTLTAGGDFDYTLEFDLRRALRNPPGQDGYLLTPRGVRLVDNVQIGHLQGEVSEQFLINQSCEVAPSNPLDPVAAVYLFPGSDLELTDLQGNSDSEDDAYASAVVRYDNVDSYLFKIGFIESGDYFAALTCNTEDDPEEVTDLEFIQGQNVTIDSGSTANVRFEE